MIYYDLRQGLTQQQCIYRINSNFGEKAPFKLSIFNWLNNFIANVGVSVINFLKVNKNCCDPRKCRCLVTNNQFRSSCIIRWNQNIFEYFKGLNAFCCMWHLKLNNMWDGLRTSLMWNGYSCDVVEGKLEKIPVPHNMSMAL